MLVRKILTFAREPLGRKRLAVEAARNIVRARFEVWRHGQFGALRAHGRLEQAEAGLPNQPADGDTARAARDVAWAVQAVAPWTRRSTPCLVEALAAARMLSRRSIPWVLNVGVGRGERPDLIAHAWDCAGGRIVTGRRGMRRVAPMARYASPVFTSRHAS